jgi:hypothetical protein
VTILAEIHEHTVPAGSEVVRSTHCNNCTRPLFVQVGKVCFCKDCAPMIKKFAQVWSCLECKTWRKWGEGHPEDFSEKSLGCVRCAKPTPHRFSHIVI